MSGCLDRIQTFVEMGGQSSQVVLTEVGREEYRNTGRIICVSTWAQPFCRSTFLRAMIPLQAITLVRELSRSLRLEPQEYSCRRMG